MIKHNVYYDKKNNMFCEIRDTTDKGYMVSNTSYFRDARTTISTVPISEATFKRDLVYVDDVSKYATYDGMGWEVKKVKKND